MPLDSLITTIPNYSRVISKPRIIAGLLAEMEAADVFLHVTRGDLPRALSMKIKCEILTPFDDSRITLCDESLETGTYTASALFAGQRISFELDVIDGQGQCRLPSKLLITDLRSSKRSSFGPDIQIAEISGEHSVTFATPVDVSHSSMALVSAVKNPLLKIGDVVQVRIRGGAFSRDVFSYKMLVRDVQYSSDVTRILLGMIEATGASRLKDSRRVARRTPCGATIVISPVDDHFGEGLVCGVEDISINGLRASIQQDSVPNWIIPGLHVKLQNGLVHASVIWRHENTVGLRLDALDESSTLSSWFKLLKQLSRTTSVHHSHLDDLVNLFTESGLLKGARRKIYGSRPARYLPPDTVTNNPLLYHRIASKVDSGKIAGQVSMVRLTDDYWFMQEGSHNGDELAVSYKQLLDNVLVVAQNLSKTSLLAPRYIGALVHSSVKSSSDLMERLCEGALNRRCDSFHISLVKQKLPVMQADSRQKVIEIKSVPARIRRQLSLVFDPVLFEVFGGMNGAHPRLNSELSQLGPEHSANSIALSEDGEVWCLAYRLKSYYALSSTGVINSLFLVVKIGTEAETLLSGIRILKERGITTGTDDVVVILDREGQECEEEYRSHLGRLISGLNASKAFTFYVFDMIALS
jgi:hypothetical protein